MSQIIPFLNGKTLFITGATGFLGKGLVEKLLRHAPDIRRIYLMIRPRKRNSGKQINADDRLVREVFRSDVFANLRREYGEQFEPVMRDKLVAVPSDLTLNRLGMDDETYSRLAQEVDIVINCAAKVTFDEPLDLALAQNTQGPLRIVEFAKACRDAVLVHVSTAYVNGRQTGEIVELSPVPNQSVAQILSNGRASEFDLESEIAAIQTYSQEVEAASNRPERIAEFHRLLDRQDRGKRITEHRRSHQVEALRQRWKRERLVARGMNRSRELGWHDSYTMTKAMGEQMIAKTRGDLPVVIVRPSIIESSLCDPEPGWLDGLKVMDPLISHYGKGRLLDFPARPGVILDIIPVDIIVNVIVSVLPTVKAEKDVKVYHVSTGSDNPVRVGEIVHLVYDYFKKNPMRDRHGQPIQVKPWKFPSLEKFQRRLKYRYQIPLKTLMWLMDRAPFGDLSRQKRRMSLLDATLDNAMALSQIYSTYVQLDCQFRTDHMRELYANLNAEDRALFNCDVSRIDWPQYMQEIHIPGLKRHVLKTNDA